VNKPVYRTQENLENTDLVENLRQAVGLKRVAKPRHVDEAHDWKYVMSCDGSTCVSSQE